MCVFSILEMLSLSHYVRNRYNRTGSVMKKAYFAVTKAGSYFYSPLKTYNIY